MSCLRHRSHAAGLPTPPHPPRHTCWPTIIQPTDRLYLTSQQGTTFVFAPDATKWTQLATNELDEKVNATPAVSNNQIFIRTADYLYCIQKK